MLQLLGWNHPGFGESTGSPHPRATLAAAEAVYQYATDVLGYADKDIVLFGECGGDSRKVTVAGVFQAGPLAASPARGSLRIIRA